MSRLILLSAVAVAAALTVAPSLAEAANSPPSSDYNYKASARAAQTWARDTSAIAPQVSERQALNPYGPTVIGSQPVPDTRANRARYGEPMSRAGKMTAPIGD